jgi:formylglycine-generating enzyme required for sulfatase activity
MITKGFYMGKYPVTQGLYQAVMGSNPSYFWDDPADGEEQARRPVENVSWYDALVFCNKLSAMEYLTPVYSISESTDPVNWGAVPQMNNDATWDAVTMNASANGYRLPTEAEWEYACRAGTSTAYNLGNNWNGDWGWYDGNSGDKTHEVGKKAPNVWSLYDMHGNVLEMVWDWYGEYGTATATDPIGSVSGDLRVGRGGSWHSATTGLRSALRSFIDPYVYWESDIGFRVARNHP